MPTTVTGTSPSATARVTMDANAGDVTETTLPSWVRTCHVHFTASDGTTAEAGFFAFSGTDGAAQDADAFRVPAGVPHPIQVRPQGAAHGGEVLYLSGTTASGYAFLHMEG